MKKIMFNDRYGLTQAVLDGRKTETRRNDVFGYMSFETVAVAQNYNDAGINPKFIVTFKKDWTIVTAFQSPGWNNKMFVRADLMPHRIQITGIRTERLQEITDESCLREGIRYIPKINKYYFERTDREEGFYFNTPREAFAALIDKVSGLGTWESNPYVAVYEFELVK